jgi:regulator of RNase E activity RraA
MIHAALALAQPGDVIVVDGKGDLSCALTGALMAAHAQKAGIAASSSTARCATRRNARAAASRFSPPAPTRTGR